MWDVKPGFPRVFKELPLLSRFLNLLLFLAISTFQKLCRGRNTFSFILLSLWCTFSVWWLLPLSSSGKFFFYYFFKIMSPPFYALFLRALALNFDVYFLSSPLTPWPEKFPQGYFLGILMKHFGNSFLFFFPLANSLFLTSISFKKNSIQFSLKLNLMVYWHGFRIKIGIFKFSSVPWTHCSGGSFFLVRKESAESPCLFLAGFDSRCMEGSTHCLPPPWPLTIAGMSGHYQSFW